MTREEAIKELSEWLDACCGGEEIEPTMEALRMAIEALKAQNGTDTNVGTNDLINRQDAIDAANDWFLDCFKVQKQDRSCGLIRRLEDLSSAQPEPTTEIQEILDYLDTTLHPIVSPDNWNVYAELHDMVSKLPSAQPEIVQCKDCKYYKKIRRTDKRWFCSNDFGINTLEIKPDDYCSNAERRTDDEE